MACRPIKREFGSNLTVYIYEKVPVFAPQQTCGLWLRNGYDKVDDLVNLRNLVIHGACIAAPTKIKGDIELLHELRKILFGIPVGESNSVGSRGPIEGAVDRYYGELIAGDADKCDRLASAAISPLHFLRLQDGAWPFAEQLVREIQQIIADNVNNGRRTRTAARATRCARRRARTRRSTSTRRAG